MLLERSRAFLHTSQWLACASFALAYSAGPAHADATPAERETARTLMQDGDNLRSAGDLRNAMAKYESAHALMRVPTTGLELARVQAQLNLLVEARGTATEVTHMPAAAREPRVFAEARTAASALADALEPRVPRLTTTVSPRHASYALSIDGVTIPAQARDVAFRANPGPHSVQVDAEGYKPETRQILLEEGKAQTLSISLQPTATGGTAPPPPTLAQAAPEPRERTSDPAAAGRLRAIAGFGAGGIALGVGVVAGAVSIAKTEDARSHCGDDGCPPSQRATLSSANTLGTVANIAIPIGLFGIAYGVYELLTLPERTDETSRARGLHLEIVGASATLRGVL